MVFYCFQVFQLIIKCINLLLQILFKFLLLCLKFNSLDLFNFIFDYRFFNFLVCSWLYLNHIFLLFLLLRSFFLLSLLNFISFVSVLLLLFVSCSHTHTSCFLICLSLLLFLQEMLSNILFCHFNLSLEQLDILVNFKMNILFLNSQFFIDFSQFFI